MPVPTTYTEEELKTFMEELMGDTARKLGWSAADGDFNEPLNEVLYFLDLDDLSSVTTRGGARKLRMVARMEAWRAAAAYTVHEASFSAGSPGTGQTNRADIHRHAKQMLESAEADLFGTYPDLGPAGLSQTVRRYSVEYPFSPYDADND